MHHGPYGTTIWAVWCCDGRVVKALDLKSNGIFPRRFEPCSQRNGFCTAIPCNWITAACQCKVPVSAAGVVQCKIIPIKWHHSTGPTISCTTDFHVHLHPFSLEVEDFLQARLGGAKPSPIYPTSDRVLFGNVFFLMLRDAQFDQTYILKHISFVSARARTGDLSRVRRTW